MWYDGAGETAGGTAGAALLDTAGKNGILPPMRRSDNSFDIQEFCARMEASLGPQDGPAHVFWKALSFAVNAHSGQRRKSGEVYVSHPCRVVEILIEELGITDPPTLAAAILHDTVEDVPEVTPAVLVDLFGSKIERIVDGCTKIRACAGSRRAGLEQVHRKIFEGASSEVEVIIIKLADRLHNLRTLDSMPRRKRQRIAEETLAVYAPLARMMGLFTMKRELYNLALSYKFPRQSQRLAARIRQAAANPTALAVRDRLRAALERSWITSEIEIRARGLSAYYDPARQVLLRDIDLPVQIIVVVESVPACYSALGIINSLYPPIPRTIRDFIANPKPTGYQSLHAKANIGGRTYLFKIRTREMLRAARSGVVREWLATGKMPGRFEQEVREHLSIFGRERDLSYREMLQASGRSEIYTYTPAGERICLPKGSIVLDFAFKIHTDIGRRCSAAMVGTRRVGAEHVLADGDTVTILTGEREVRFHPSVLKQCQSPRARAEINRLFRQRIDNLSRRVGEAMLRQELRRYGIPREVLDRPEMAQLVAVFGLADLDALYRDLGKGRRRLPEVIYEIRSGIWAGRQTLPPPTGALNQVQLSGLDPVGIKLSRCCNPLPTEHGLLGFPSERGLSVHRKDCPRLADIRFQREDVVEVRWNCKQTVVEQEQTLLVLDAPRQRLLMVLGTAPAAMRLRDVTLLSRPEAQRADWEIRFQVPTLADLRSILHHLAQAGLRWEFVIEL